MPTSPQSSWRQDFPALAAFDRDDIVYLDNAATTQKPAALLDQMQRVYRQGIANVHRAQHQPGQRATQAYEYARQRIRQWLNARRDDQLVFTHGATDALNLLAYGLEHHFQPGDRIVVSALEHHANLVPWQQLAARKGLRLTVLPLTPQGAIDLDLANGLITSRTRLLAISQLSNVLGTWQPLAPLMAMARQVGAWTVVDGAQGVVHGGNDLSAIDCDFYVFSGHKLYGPDGIGVLWGTTAALSALRPSQFGGEMVEWVTYEAARFQAPPQGLEAGTPPVSAAIGLAGVIDWLDRQDCSAWRHHEATLHQQLVNGLHERPKLHLLGQPQAALASFTVQDIHAADIASLLDEQGIAVRAGHHCAMPLLDALGASSAVRVSLAIYNDANDLTRFFQALDRALKILS